MGLPPLYGQTRIDLVLANCMALRNPYVLFSAHIDYCFCGAHVHAFAYTVSIYMVLLVPNFTKL